MLPRSFDRINQVHTQQYIYSYDGFALSVHFVFNVLSESMSNTGDKFSLSFHYLQVHLMQVIACSRCNPWTNVLSVFPENTVKPMILLGIYVNVLIDALRYGISMIHIIRGRTGPVWTRDVGVQRYGTPWHPPNARLVLFTSLSSGSNSSFQSKESREREPFIGVWRAPCDSGCSGRWLEYSVSHS